VEEALGLHLARLVEVQRLQEASMDARLELLEAVGLLTGDGVAVDRVVSLAENGGLPDFR
jgi:hypothetical protein